MQRGCECPQDTGALQTLPRTRAAVATSPRVPHPWASRREWQRVARLATSEPAPPHAAGIHAISAAVRPSLLRCEPQIPSTQPIKSGLCVASPRLCRSRDERGCARCGTAPARQHGLCDPAATAACHRASRASHQLLGLLLGLELVEHGQVGKHG